MLGGHGGGNLSSKIVQLHVGDPGVEAIDHLQSFLGGIDVIDGLRPAIPLQDHHLAAVNLRHPDCFFYFAVTGAGV